MILAQPYWLLLLLLLPVPWIWFRRRGRVGFSDVRLVSGIKGWSIPEKLPLLFYSLAFVALVVALARPQKLHAEEKESIRSRDIIIAVDISGSMASRFKGTVPKVEHQDSDLSKELPAKPILYGYANNEPAYPKGEEMQRRIDAAQGVILRFVAKEYEAHNGDRIGIETFDYSPRFCWPLTNDLKMIYRYGLFVDQGMGGGTNFGEYPPGPIDAAAEHFDELGLADTRVLIMVTDGDDELSGVALMRLKQVIESHHIRFYVIGMGEVLANKHVDIMTLAESVGGKVYRVENAQDLSDCFDNINQLSRSVILVNKSTRHDDAFSTWAAVSVILFLLGLLSEALIVGQ